MFADSISRSLLPIRPGSAKASKPSPSAPAAILISSIIIAAGGPMTGASASETGHDHKRIVATQPSPLPHEQVASVSAPVPTQHLEERDVPNSGQALVDDDGLLPNGIFANTGIIGP